MKIFLGTTELTITKGYPAEDRTKKREYHIWIPKTEITHDDLNVVLVSLKETDGKITLTNDDGSSITSMGYYASSEIIDKIEEDVYYVKILCVDEALRKSLEAKQMVAELRQATALENAQLRIEMENIAGRNDGASWDEIANAIEEGVNEV